jgi:hypothetical protein
MLENNASSHYEGFSEAYVSTITHPLISLNRSAITGTSFRLSGFMEEKIFAP